MGSCLVAPRRGSTRVPSKEDVFVRQRILLVVVTCLAAILVPSLGAQASSRQFTTVEAPAELLFGSSPESALDQVAALGATAVRIQLSWDLVAPDPDARTAPSFNQTDPNAYPTANWARYDRAIDGARTRGLQVLLTLAGGAPRWATAAKRDHLTRPNAKLFGKFATAVGRRYGSDVSWWSVWNEPNLGKLLKPIKGLESARVYRDLYLRAYAGLRSASVTAPILFGELAPIGNTLSDIGTIRPLRFLRAALCLDGSYHKVGKGCAKLPAQGFAMHPYTTGVGPRFVPPNVDDVTIGVLSRLTRALDRAASAGALARRLPVYVTEFGIQSFPDPRLGVTLAQQSDYRSLAEKMAYDNARVRSFSQYLLRDDDPRDGAYGAFESGLILFKNLKLKPSFEGFRLPLVVKPAGSGRVALWGLVRPANGQPGSLTIQMRDGRGAWKAFATKHYGTSGYWKRTGPAKSGRSWRVRWTAPDGTLHTGPATIAR